MDDCAVMKCDWFGLELWGRKNSTMGAELGFEIGLIWHCERSCLAFMERAHWEREKEVCVHVA